MTKIRGSYCYAAIILLDQYDIVEKKLDVHMRMEIVEFDIDIDNGFTNDL